MQPKPSIFFIIPSLHGGGSERVITHLIRNLNPDLFSITLVLVKKEGVFLSAIPEQVPIIVLNSSQTRYIPVKLVKLIWQHKPDIVFSTLGHLNLIIATLRFLMPAKTRFIARESSMVSLHNKNERFPIIFNLLFKTVYKSFYKIVCQSRYMQQDLIENYNIPLSKTFVINNPIDFKLINSHINVQQSPYEPGFVNFVAVGRLSVEKGYNRLIDAFAAVPEQNIKLTIIGEGDDYDLLVKRIAERGLENKVCLARFIKNPYNYMFHAHALIITSHYEGFPNVVIEANACGTPVIAMNSPGGISEIIDENRNGWLIQDDNILALTQKIREVALLPKPAPAALVQLAEQKYSLAYIIQKYEGLFTEALKQNS
ncbi:glycosyltransferase [Adhaeribacter rhizoryzae]|uniref:Glycosyltransferase n=1 Tax=Adhaeribacter rhizoryzae TaxID=2607907 RepID=A0A5M6DEY8_9BACT|nr:glycosyltransferase [Adhaeribacter rhizoryzae]KAA5544749.1 glycosyltransferase [Adhaeribacter rhizoryzae]